MARSLCLLAALALAVLAANDNPTYVTVYSPWESEAIGKVDDSIGLSAVGVESGLIILAIGCFEGRDRCPATMMQGPSTMWIRPDPEFKHQGVPCVYTSAPYPTHVENADA